MNELEYYQNDIVAFVEDILKIKLSDFQKDILIKEWEERKDENSNYRK